MPPWVYGYDAEGDTSTTTTFAVLLGDAADHAATAESTVASMSEVPFAGAVVLAANTGSKVVVAERVGGQALKPGEAVSRWDEFLGSGPTTNLRNDQIWTGYPTNVARNP